MTVRTILARMAVGSLAAFIAACSAVSGSGTLTTGMSPDQTVQAMGPPDLKDNVADPSHSGATVLRYVWLDQGKAAVFGANDRVASIQNVETDTKEKVEQQAAADANPGYWDPLETPLNYFFFPVKAGFTYLGAGLNCVGGGSCQKPHIKPPSNG